MSENTQPSVSIKAYHSQVYDHLHLFRDAKVLLKNNQHLLEQLGDVIVQHNLHEHVGISLLHKHFELLRDEVLVRNFDMQRRTAHIRPTPRRPGAVPYLWRAQIGVGGAQHFFPLEFLAEPREHDPRSTDISKLEPFLHDIADVLARLDLLDVFGIATTNIFSIPHGEDEILVETTDAEKRLLTIEAERRAELIVSELTETFWTFTPVDKSINLEQIMKCRGQHCTGHCRGHCHAHCKNHCRSHCKSHCKHDAEDIGPDLKGIGNPIPSEPRIR